MNNSNFRLLLSGLALGVLLALLIAPQTRWLVRLQALTVLHQYHPLPIAAYTTSGPNDLRLLQTAAARKPDDFLLQYGLAASYPNDQTVLNLRALKKHFPNRPELIANILRYESRKMNFDRSDGSPLSEQAMRGNPHFAAIPPKTLAAYDQEAVEGEKLDPDNAYFPLMRAHGLLAAHRDTEALLAVLRASVKPLWREYLPEDNMAHWHIHTAAFGDPGALGRISLASEQALWQTGHLRQTARLIVYQAILKEQAGYPEEGLALREAVRRIGDLMRTQSTLLIGSLVGTAISAISQTRPGGGPYLEDPPSLQPEQKAQKRLDTYCAYVTKIGHPEAARRARDEEAARQSVSIMQEGSKTKFPDWTEPIVRLTLWWMADIAVILNIGWLGVFGLLAAWRDRKPGAGNPKIDWKSVAVQITTALGLWLIAGLFALLVANFFKFTISDSSALVWRVASGLFGVAALAIWLVTSSLRRMPVARRKAALKMAVLLPLLAGLIYGLYCLIQWSAAPLAEVPTAMRQLVNLSGGSTDSDIEQAKLTQTLLLCILGTLAVPLLLALIFSINALVRRAALANAFRSGFHHFALPTICFLLIAYGGILLGTVRQDNRLHEILKQTTTNGGRYYASLAGEKWPGPVR